MGGQACVFYGAAEFSRGLDLPIPADAANVTSLKRALDALDAEAIDVPDGHQPRRMRTRTGPWGEGYYIFSPVPSCTARASLTAKGGTRRKRSGEF